MEKFYQMYDAVAFEIFVVSVYCLHLRLLYSVYKILSKANRMKQDGLDDFLYKIHKILTEGPPGKGNESYDPGTKKHTDKTIPISLFLFMTLYSGSILYFFVL